MDFLKLVNPKHPERGDPSLIESTFRDAATVAVEKPVEAAKLLTEYATATTDYEADKTGLRLTNMALGL